MRGAVRTGSRFPKGLGASRETGSWRKARAKSSARQTWFFSFWSETARGSAGSSTRAGHVKVSSGLRSYPELGVPSQAHVVTEVPNLSPGGPTRFWAKTSLVVSRPKDKVALCVARSKKTVVSAVDRATPATGVTHFRAWPRGGPASSPRPAATRPQPAPLPASPRLTPASSSPAGARPESGASPRGLAHHHPHPEWPHTVLRKTWGDGAMRRGGLRSRGFPRRLTVYPRAPLVSLPFCRTPA